MVNKTRAMTSQFYVTQKPTLGQLPDVDLVGPPAVQDGDHLKWNETLMIWEPEAPPVPGANKLDDLSDVQITGAINDKQILIGDGTGKLVNRTANLNDLDDVNHNTDDRDVLYWVAANARFENKDPQLHWQNTLVTQNTPTDVVFKVDQLTQTIRVGTYSGTPSAGQFSVYIGDNSGLQHLSSAQNNFALGRAVMIRRVGGIGPIFDFSGVRNVNVGSRIYYNSNYSSTVCLGTEIVCTGSNRTFLGNSLTGIYRVVRTAGVAGSRVLRLAPNGEVVAQPSCSMKKTTVVDPLGESIDAAAAKLYNIPVGFWEFNDDPGHYFCGLMSNDVESAFNAVQTTQPAKCNQSYNIVEYGFDEVWDNTDPDDPHLTSRDMNTTCATLDTDKSLTGLMLRLIQLQKIDLDAKQVQINDLLARVAVLEGA
jgi:hypothetical protein